LTYALFFHLGGDIDMLGPFVTPLGQGDISAEKIIVAEALLLGNPRLTVLLGTYGRKPDAILPLDAPEDALTAALAGCTALLTASETTLRPHRLAHALANRANALGLRTATLQHGIENVGITYFDERQGPEVTFASSHVLTWTGNDRLEKGIQPVTASKVMDAGLPGPPDDAVFAAWRERMAIPNAGRKIIGVFENLHWTRFSDDYRARFLADLQEATQNFPDLFFLLKPHPEGRWLTDRFSGPRPESDNLLIANPKAPVWNMLTAPYVMPLLSAVVTTPSKVALDAALANVPVAVTSYDGVYARYADLPALAALPDWEGFLGDVRDGHLSAFDAANRAMIDRSVSAVGTEARIREWLMSSEPAATTADVRMAT